MDGEVRGEPEVQGPIKAVSLLSGGLDSILATRLVQDQGIEVLALHFVSAFFGAHERGREAEVAARYRDRYGLTVRVVDVSEAYLEVLGNPHYGYGKNFNPCVDCKIFFLRQAAAVMAAEGAHFLVTGEVVGQRPMSQRRDAMNAVARASGVRELILRPLSARILPPTAPERRGWVDRSRLLGLSGRGRKGQIALAARLGVEDYPNPAGGCRLTDPILAARIRRYFEMTPAAVRRSADVGLLLVGRPFRLPGGSWFTVGRDDPENRAIAALAEPGDEQAWSRGAPGPLGLLRSPPGVDDRAAAASVLIRYTPKAKGRGPVGFGPHFEGPPTREVEASAAADGDLEGWRV